VTLLTEASPEAIVAALKRVGYNDLKAAEDDDGDLAISAVDGIAQLSVRFADCDLDAKHCGFVQASQCWKLPDVPALNDRMTLWNKYSIWALGYVDDFKDPCMAMAIDFNGGITTANLDSIVHRWQGAVDDFKTAIGLNK
jgi:hypothetical protein